MEKKCYRCGNENVFEHLGSLICNNCFVKLIEKRVKKGLGKVFFRDAKLLVVGDLAEYFVKNVVGGLPVKITKRKVLPSDLSDFDKVIVEETMDDVDSGFLTKFFGKDFKIENDEKVVKILKSITDEEAVRFAKIKGIKFQANEKNTEIKNFLKKISEKHPEVRYNLLKNVSEVEKILD